MTPEEWDMAPLPEQLIALADALVESADRCRNNVVFADSWVEGTLRGTADRLVTLAYREQFKAELEKHLPIRKPTP